MHGNVSEMERAAPGTLPLPAAVPPIRIAWPYATIVIGYHAIALLALLPWFFSWTGVVLCILGIYVYGGLGINLCYHRLLTHRGFVLPQWLEHTFAVIGVCCMQDTPARWVAVHRRHHQHADEQPDPHSPLVNFFWGHMGWILVENDELRRIGIFDRYARDVLRDPFYVWMERTQAWITFGIATWFIYFGLAYGAALLGGGSQSAALQFASSVLIWGVFVRTVAVWHITWSVNSLSHRWGYRNYETDEGSRNNWFVVLITSGEGWHNNHHADPRAASHGHRWWEWDGIFQVVRVLRFVGLAKDVALPRPHIAKLYGQSDKVRTHEYSVSPTE